MSEANGRTPPTPQAPVAPKPPQVPTTMPGDIVQGDGQTLDRVIKALHRAFNISHIPSSTLRETVEAVKEQHNRELRIAKKVSESVPDQAEEPAFLPPATTEAEAAPLSFLPTVLYEAIKRVPTLALSAPAAPELLHECIDLAVFLMAKNAAYGDSALKPLRAISKADAAEQIRVRMDDKLSRIIRGKNAGEDPLQDLVGYWILLKVLERRNTNEAMMLERGG